MEIKRKACRGSDFFCFVCCFSFHRCALFKGPAGHGVFVVDLHGAKKGGKTLVIAHGFPTSSFEWQHVLSLLLPHFERVVLFDYVGFGLSDKPILESGAYSVPDHADTLGFVIGSLEQESDKIELLCHDMSDSVCSELISRGFQGFDHFGFFLVFFGFFFFFFFFFFFEI